LHLLQEVELVKATLELLLTHALVLESKHAQLAEHELLELGLVPLDQERLLIATRSAVHQIAQLTVAQLKVAQTLGLVNEHLVLHDVGKVAGSLDLNHRARVQVNAIHLTTNPKIVEISVDKLTIGPEARALDAIKVVDHVLLQNGASLQANELARLALVGLELLIVARRHAVLLLAAAARGGNGGIKRQLSLRRAVEAARLLLRLLLGRGRRRRRQTVVVVRLELLQQVAAQLLLLDLLGERAVEVGRGGRRTLTCCRGRSYRGRRLGRRGRLAGRLAGRWRRLCGRLLKRVELLIDARENVVIVELELTIARE